MDFLFALVLLPLFIGGVYFVLVMIPEGISKQLYNAKCNRIAKRRTPEEQEYFDALHERYGN